MDGSHSNASIGLHKEWMNSSNIVDLLLKHGVPMAYDHVTVDVDLNTFWVLRVSLLLLKGTMHALLDCHRASFPSEVVGRHSSIYL